MLNEEGKEEAIFTGDTLFLGDVGRPDLAQKGNELTQEDLAGMLYDSLRNKIMPLPDTVTVYPAHGAGSACGKNMMKETVDTLGNQSRSITPCAICLKSNLLPRLRMACCRLLAIFPLNVKMNKEGYSDIDDVCNWVLQNSIPKLLSNWPTMVR